MTSLPQNNDFYGTGFEKQAGNQLFPVFLKLNQLHTVLIGAGNVGLEKLTAMLRNSPGAKVTVIALAFLPQVHVLAAEYKDVTIKQKAFADTDLDNANLVVAATNDRELNNSISRAAHERRLLINIADKPELCDFYLSSIVQKGDLKIAISTNGKSPTMAKRLKDVLNDSLPADLDTALQQLNQLRNSLSGDFAEKVRVLNELTSVLINEQETKNNSSRNNHLLG